MSKVWGLIPARLDSSRLYGKALLDLHGLPMIIHVAKRALLSDSLDEVIVCTDSDRIAQTCIDHRINVCFTSSHCRNGTERIYEGALAIGCGDNDVLIDIQGDEPLISPDSISSVVRVARERLSEFDIVLPHLNNCHTANPNVVKVVCSGARVLYLTRSDAPFEFSADRPMKKHLSVVGFSLRALELFVNSPEGELERLEGVELLRALEIGMRIYTFPLIGDSFSVDVLEDFERAEKALERCPLFRGHYA